MAYEQAKTAKHWRTWSKEAEKKNSAKSDAFKMVIEDTIFLIVHFKHCLENHSIFQRLSGGVSNSSNFYFGVYYNEYRRIIKKATIDL